VQETERYPSAALEMSMEMVSVPRTVVPGLSGTRTFGVLSRVPCTVSVESEDASPATIWERVLEEFWPQPAKPPAAAVSRRTRESG
jgi:hypothetical protein